MGRFCEGINNKIFFPNVTHRLKLRIDLKPNITALVTGQRKIRAYINRFNVLEQATYTCNNGDQKKTI